MVYLLPDFLRVLSQHVLPQVGIDLLVRITPTKVVFIAFVDQHDVLFAELVFRLYSMSRCCFYFASAHILIFILNHLARSFVPMACT